jgi:hypothetical protein
LFLRNWPGSHQVSGTPLIYVLLVPVREEQGGVAVMVEASIPPAPIYSKPQCDVSCFRWFAFAPMLLQVSSPLAVGHLLQMLGSQQAAGSSSSSFAGAAVVSSDGSSAALMPSDTLQLVLDFLQQRMPACHQSARGSHGGEAMRSSVAAAGSHRCLASAAASGTGNSSAAAAAPGGAEAAAEGAAGDALQANTVKAHCWHLLTAVLQLAAMWHANRPGGPFHYAVL